MSQPLFYRLKWVFLRKTLYYTKSDKQIKKVSQKILGILTVGWRRRRFSIISDIHLERASKDCNSLKMLHDSQILMKQSWKIIWFHFMSCTTPVKSDQSTLGWWYMTYQVCHPPVWCNQPKKKAYLSVMTSKMTCLDSSHKNISIVSDDDLLCLGQHS